MGQDQSHQGGSGSGEKQGWSAPLDNFSWNDPLKSFNEAGMGGLQRDVYGGGGDQSHGGGGGRPPPLWGAESAAPRARGREFGEEPSEEEEEEGGGEGHTHGGEGHTHGVQDTRDGNAEKGEFSTAGMVKQRPEDYRQPPLSALKRSTAKLSAFMSKESILELQMQEQQRAHNTQRRAIEKTFEERSRSKSQLSQDMQKLKDSIEEAKEKAYSTHEYRTHSAHLFEGYAKFAGKQPK